MAREEKAEAELNRVMALADDEQIAEDPGQTPS